VRIAPQPCEKRRDQVWQVRSWWLGLVEIGGWRTRRVYDRCAIITENDIVDAVRKLEADRKEREAVAVKIAAVGHESVTKSTQVQTRVAKAELLN